MLPFSKLSYWERTSYLEENDFVIVGAGIVGMCAALQLKLRFKKAKVLILERSYIPTGASTKNAGFACFGSPTELWDDLQKIPESVVWETVSMRMEGLQELLSLVGKNSIEYETCGSWDLIQAHEKLLEPQFLSYLNERLYEINGEKTVYSEDKTIFHQTGMKGFKSAYKNRLEGSIHTGKLMDELHKQCVHLGIHFLFGIELKQFDSTANHVLLETNVGAFQAHNLLICTNAFAQHLLPGIAPARAQVLMTKPMTDFSLKGTFHFDSGYYYFRGIENRVLFGGGRNLDLVGETSTEFSTTALIQDTLHRYLKENILPSVDFEIDYAWSGIMAVGKEKKPIIQKTNKNVAFGVRMGGMGIAIGASVGKELSNLF